MFVAIIILSVIMAIAIVIFAVKAANVKNAIEDIYAKQALLHEKYCNHEDRIDGNYKSLAELSGQIKALQDYNAEKEKRAREAVEEFKNTMNCIAAIARKRAKKAAKAKETAKAPDTPTTAPRETRDAKQTAAANRARFAELRNTLSVREAAKELGVSLTTAKRYEKWRKEHEQ